MDEQISNQLQDFKTDEKELEEVLSRYDLDEALEAEFNAIESHFQQLLIAYQTLLNTYKSPWLSEAITPSRTAQRMWL